MTAANATINAAGMTALLENVGISNHSVFRPLLWMIANMDDRNQIKVDQGVLSDKLGMNRGTLYLQIKDLVKYRAIRVLDPKARVKTFVINPDLATRTLTKDALAAEFSKM